MRNLHAFVNDEAKSWMVAIQVQHVEKLGIVQCLDVDPTIIICCIMRHKKIPTATSPNNLGSRTPCVDTVFSGAA